MLPAVPVHCKWEVVRVAMVFVVEGWIDTGWTDSWHTALRCCPLTTRGRAEARCSPG